MKICIIGASGKLGKYMVQQPLVKVDIVGCLYSHRRDIPCHPLELFSYIDRT